MLTQAQRQIRRKFLGSSDTPKIMRLLPFGDPKEKEKEVYWSKVAELPDEEAPDYMQVGNWLEGPILEWAAGELGVKITRKSKDLFQVKDGGIFAANHDSLIIGKNESIEGKYANGDMVKTYGEPYTDQVPDYIIVQVQHQMYVSDLSKVYVALATPSYYGIDRRLYVVPRDNEIIETIVDFGQRWWNKYVETKTPPDGESVPPMPVLRALERRTGAQIRLLDDAVVWADNRIAAKEEIKRQEDIVETNDRKLIHALGDAEIGLLPGGRKVTYLKYESNRFDIKRFRLEKPEIAADYMNQTFHRTLYIKNK